ncbi:MAG: helix-turn-helix domain-containing protein [Rhodoferax sp.]|uniref:helix-turn-helix domain-containing protein n=1 Tax=Rhodoferax sp. TaxID=50421 RepID=UPI001B6543DA|nr:helix-turn-helix domain-containing protein [Rhodoferax sp.]MBP9906727.1 helix-turn-helix domain-containing protein [Rhodoferax sp.]
MHSAVKSKTRPVKVDNIPSFSLYGEAAAPGQEMLHIEDVQSRSQLYQWEIEPHLHQGLYQVLWLYQGSAEVMLDERRHRVTGPAAIVLTPGVVHGFRFEQGTHGMVLTLSARFLLEGELQSVGEAFHSLFAASGVLPLTAEPEVAQRLNALFHELLAEFTLPGSDVSPIPTWLARALVWRLSRAGALVQQVQGRRAHRHQALFMRFLLLVEQNFRDHWPLDRYASRLGLSTPRLNRLVRAERGISALELVHERLTREACRRLVYVAVPVASLASDLGFDDPAYFSRFFRRRTGLSPQGYRQAHGGQD